MAHEEKTPFAFDGNGSLPSAHWDALLRQLDEEIRQLEERDARAAGWSEEADELLMPDEVWGEEVLEEEELFDEEDPDGEEPEGEDFFEEEDLDAF